MNAPNAITLPSGRDLDDMDGCFGIPAARHIFNAIGESIRLDDTTGAPCTFRPMRDNEFDFFRLDCICYHVYGGETPPFTMREYKRVPKVLHGLLPYKIAEYIRARIEANK